MLEPTAEPPGRLLLEIQLGGRAHERLGHQLPADGVSPRADPGFGLLGLKLGESRKEGACAVRTPGVELL